MDEVQIYMKKRKPVVLISGSIFSSAYFYWFSIFISIKWTFWIIWNGKFWNYYGNFRIITKILDYSIEIFFDFFVTGIINTKIPFSYFADSIFSSPSLISIGNLIFLLILLGLWFEINVFESSSSIIFQL